ncbi:MAG TPA: TetR family transcriptional regulator [Mycobacteriales bacterium]|nr:TetR family transcriptional regulator [Mycobacteriales bacterium]
MTAASTRLPRGSLDRAAIEAAARTVIDDVGVEEFSIPRLARALGVRPTAVHWHFKRKEDLLASLSLHALRTFNARLPGSGDDTWQVEINRYWTEYRTILREDRVLLELLVVRWTELAQDPEAVRLSYERINRQLELLLAAGFTPEGAARAYHTLSTYCRGCLLNERASLRSGLPDPARRLAPHRVGADLTGLGAMQRAAPYWTFTFSTSQDYAAGLHTIITGLERELESATR